MNFFKKILQLLGFLRESDPETPNIDAITVHENVPIQEKREQVILGTELNYTTPETFPIVLKSSNKTAGSYLEVRDRKDKGVMEDYFFDYADIELKKKLKNDTQIELSSYIITPDFIYVDEDKSIFVVIEIDEPYSINDSGEFIPTHYKGLDDHRNKTLLGHGWNILRFAEEQVVKNPIACSKFIKDFINSQNHNQINPINCWTFVEARKMIDDVYRNTYLPIKFQGTLRTDSKYSFRSLTITSIRCFNSKKDERFTVLDLCKNIELVPGGYRADPCGTCWISEHIFADKISGSEYGEYLKSIGTDYTFFYNLGYFLFPKVRLEALGYQEIQYFNLRSPDEFNIIYPPNFYPTRLHDEEYRQKHNNIMLRLIQEHKKLKYVVWGKQPDGKWLNHW